MATDTRMDSCFDLRKTYYPYAPVDSEFECISFPFPDETNGISIMLRVKDDPTTLRQVKIADSDWRRRATTETSRLDQVSR